LKSIAQEQKQKQKQKQKQMGKKKKKKKKSEEGGYPTFGKNRHIEGYPTCPALFLP
jgi:hypothetical protein